MGEFSTIEEAIEAIARGEVVIVVDAEDLEQGGDFICAAERATPEAVNLVMSGGGEFYVAVLPELAESLALEPLSGQADRGTMAHLMAIDHRDVQTGITASDRAATIRAMIDPESNREHFVRPGHVQPL